MKSLIRIPLHKLMDLKIDYAFKQLFGNESNKKITVVFLNAILKRTGKSEIKDITFKNIEFFGETEDEKQSRLDLLVVTHLDEWINVEIQFTNQYDMVKRTLFYWSRIFNRQLDKGLSYMQLRPVITVNILNFELFHDKDEFHTICHLYDERKTSKITDVLEIHFIEITKLLRQWKEQRLDPWNDVLARWLLLLGMVDHRKQKVYEDIYRELEGIAMKDERLVDAFSQWQELSMTMQEKLEYEARLKHILDEESAAIEARLRIEEAEKRAQEAEERALHAEKNSIEIERNAIKVLLQQQFTSNEIAVMMDIPLARIIEIENELNPE